MTWKHLQNGVQSAQFSKKDLWQTDRRKQRGENHIIDKTSNTPLKKKTLREHVFTILLLALKNKVKQCFVALVVFFPGIFKYCTHTHSDVLFGGLDCTENKILKRKLSEEHFWKRWIFCVKSGSVCFYWAGLEELKLKCIQREHVWTSEKKYGSISMLVYGIRLSREDTHTVL